MSRWRHRSGADTVIRLPLVALIDVVLFLLLYFIIEGNFGTPESRIASTLATSGGRGPADLVPQVVAVEPADGGVVFRIGQRALRNRDELAGVLEGLPKNVGVVIRVSDRVPVEAAAAALQAARNAGFAKVSYVPMGS